VDENWILVRYTQEDRRSLDRINVDTGQRQRLNPDYRTDWYQVMAVDGQQYIFDPSPDSPLTLYHIQSGHFRDRSTVLPDPQWIIYLAGTSVNSALYRMHHDRSGVQLLTDGNSVDWLQAWSPDARWLYYSSRKNGNRHLFRMHSDGSHQQQLTNAFHDLWFQAWSPDGQWMILTANTARGEPTALYRMRPDGRHLQQLTFPVDGHHFFETWATPPNLPFNQLTMVILASGIIGFTFFWRKLWLQHSGKLWRV
jgi:Tol biopolymer transport system component